MANSATALGIVAQVHEARHQQGAIMNCQFRAAAMP